MKARKKSHKDRNLHLALFVITALFLFSPLLVAYNLEAFKGLGLLGIGLINFISSATLFFPAPGFLAVGIGSKFFNPIVVAAVAALGAALGEIVGFTFGYSSKKITNSEKHILDVVAHFFHHKHSAILIVLLSFIPNPFFDAVGIVAGASLFPLKKFLVLVFIGRFIRNILIAYAGQHFL